MNDKARTLRRLQTIALGLLLAALALLFFSAWMGGQGVWAWSMAFAEAAVVGALADWFAVVALFRRPLGLPLAHTAIIPSNKNRIADQLALFVRDHFLEPQVLLHKLAVFDPAKRFAEWLHEPSQVQAWVHATRGWALQALDWLDDQRLQQAVRDLLFDALQRWDSAKTASQVLSALTREGRHHAVLDAALLKLAHLLDQPEIKAQVADKLAGYARAEWPKMIGVLGVFKSVDKLSDELADKLAQAMILDLINVLQTPQHPWRLRYESEVQAWIQRLAEDAKVRAAFAEVKESLLQSPLVQDYSRVLLGELKAWLREDLSRDDSRLAQHAQQALQRVGEALQQDAGLRAALNQHLLAAADKLVLDVRDGVTEHIARTVKNWDEKQLVQTLELSVGADLQYIRLNGTLVGGLIGVVLHAALTYGLPLIS